jgi:hypothetical protein
MESYAEFAVELDNLVGAHAGNGQMSSAAVGDFRAHFLKRGMGAGGKSFLMMRRGASHGLIGALQEFYRFPRSARAILG